VLRAVIATAAVHKMHPTDNNMRCAVICISSCFFSLALEYPLHRMDKMPDVKTTWQCLQCGLLNAYLFLNA
jgi:hypothetical protein